MNDLAATAVYVLCFLTSACCALLLVRGYRRTRMRLLLWTATCFVMLALTNFLLVIDLVLLPDIGLRAARLSTSFVGVAVLIYGFIWEVD